MRRRIVALSVGMTFLVVLAFSVPLALVVRQNIESKHLDEARFQADNVAYFISSQEPDGDQVASYIDGSSGRYDLIVGADGINSTVRESLFGVQPVRFTQQMAWRCIVPMTRTSTPARACLSIRRSISSSLRRLS